MNCLQACFFETHLFSRHRLSVRAASCMNIVMSVALVASKIIYFGLAIPAFGMCLSYYSYKLESQGAPSSTCDAISKYMDMASISLACVLGIIMLCKLQIMAGLFLLIVQALNILISKRLFLSINKPDGTFKIGYNQKAVSRSFYLLISFWIAIYAFVGIGYLAIRVFS